MYCSKVYIEPFVFCFCLFITIEMYTRILFIQFFYYYNNNKFVLVSIQNLEYSRIYYNIQ
jgi:hypothetical protein